MEWFSIKDVIGLVGLPSTLMGVHKVAKREGWVSRRKEGVRGKALEFSVSSLPPVTQAALLRKSGKVVVGGMTLDLPKPQAPRYCKEQLWANWDKANDKGKDKAKDRLKAVQAVHALVANGSTLMEAYQHIATEFDVALPTLRRYCAAVKGFDDCDWLAVAARVN